MHICAAPMQIPTESHFRKTEATHGRPDNAVRQIYSAPEPISTGKDNRRPPLIDTRPIFIPPDKTIWFTTTGRRSTAGLCKSPLFAGDGETHPAAALRNLIYGSSAYQWEVSGGVQIWNSARQKKWTKVRPRGPRAPPPELFAKDGWFAGFAAERRLSKVTALVFSLWGALGQPTR